MSRFPLALLALTSLVGCSTPEAPPQAEPGPAAKQEAPVDEAPSPDEAPDAAPAVETEHVQLAPGEVRMELLGAGEGTTGALRYAPKAGSSESFAMVLDLVVGMDMGGANPKVTNLPPIRMEVDAKLAEVRPNGDLSYDLTLAKTSIQPPEAVVDMSDAKKAELAKINEQTKAEAARYEGTTGQMVVSARGLLVSSEIHPPEGAKPFQNFDKALSHALVPLPEEPIGVGASWTVLQDVKESGLALQQTKTYTVKSIQGSKVELGVTLEQQGDHRSFKMDNLPEGTTADLVALVSNGEGTASIRLDRLFPLSNTLKQDFEARVAVGQQGKGMLVGLTMDMDLAIEKD